MSETVHYKGKAVKVNCEDNEEYSLKILELKSTARLDFYDSALEQIIQEYSTDFFYDSTNEILYSIEYESHDLEEEIIKAEIQKDGSIDFELRFYNGGAGFEECLQEAMDKLN